MRGYYAEWNICDMMLRMFRNKQRVGTYRSNVICCFMLLKKRILLNLLTKLRKRERELIQNAVRKKKIIRGSSTVYYLTRNEFRISGFDPPTAESFFADSLTNTSLFLILEEEHKNFVHFH